MAIDASPMVCLKRMDATINSRMEETMDKYVCTLCGYVYDPEQGDPDNGVAPGTKWEDVPADWECPVCGAGKDDFEKEE
jgi:rubredoxin